MNPPDWLSESWSIVKELLRRLARFVKNHPSFLFWFAVGFFAIDRVVDYFNRSTDREITIYVGSPGSSSYRISDRIAAAVRDIETVPGFHYRAKVVPTVSQVEIEREVSDDMHGRSIGLTVDGIHHAESLRTLLPLDWDYLHILVRVGFIDRLLSENKLKAWPSEFSEVAQHVEYDRLYCGMPDSGTFQFAEELFGRFNKKPAKLYAPGISNPEQAAAAIEAGRLDMAFYCGPLGATTVSKIAESGTAVLLGLSDLAESMVKGNEVSVVRVRIPPNHYRAAAIEHVTHTQLPPLYFCGHELPTVAARRLVVASSRMSEQDAYLISKSLAEKLVDSQDISPNTWKRKSPEAPAATLDSDFGIRTHPGAAYWRDQKEPWSIWKPWTWGTIDRSFAIGMATLVLTSLLQAIRRRLKPPTPAATEPNNPSPAG